jgi:hypothetical protein
MPSDALHCEVRVESCSDSKVEYCRREEHRSAGRVPQRNTTNYSFVLYSAATKLRALYIVPDICMFLMFLMKNALCSEIIIKTLAGVTLDKP